MIPADHPRLKSRCIGPSTLSTKVDDEMRSFISRQAEQAEVSRSEVLRRLLDFYRENTDFVNREVEL
jgi:negative regulator of replication initiation